jgi:hypothetical protein
MDVELKFHIEAYAEDLVRNGVPRQERCDGRDSSLAESSEPKKNAVKRAV